MRRLLKRLLLVMIVGVVFFLGWLGFTLRDWGGDSMPSSGEIERRVEATIRQGEEERIDGVEATCVQESDEGRYTCFAEIFAEGESVRVGVDVVCESDDRCIQRRSP